MRILISNDDGIYAAGINALIDLLCEDHELYVAAPTLQKSASSHALTMQQPITVKEVKDPRTAMSWAIGGFPADCTKLALEELLGFKPDWVISGINHGPNVGTDLLYSGTVAAAVEGILFNIPSISISHLDYDGSTLDEGIKAVKEALDWLFENPVGGKTLININVPNIPYADMKGLKIVRIGETRYDRPFTQRLDPRGNTYYWLAGELILGSDSDDTDVIAAQKGYITISPVKFDFDDWEANHLLSEKLKERTSAQGGDSPVAVTL